MYYDFRVKIPDEKGKIYTKTIKGVVYVNYEYDRVYKPDKKYNIPKRTTIGKMCDDDPDMMYPNPNYLTYFPDAELPKDKGRDDRSSCLRIPILLECFWDNIKYFVAEIAVSISATIMLSGKITGS